MRPLRSPARGQQEATNRLRDDQVAYTTRVSDTHMPDIMSYLVTSQQYKKDSGWWVALCWRTDHTQKYEMTHVPQSVYLRFRATHYEEMIVVLR